jgi:hypothetical protein
MLLKISMSASLLLVLFTLSAHAIAADPAISLSPASGPCGSSVLVTGTGFPPARDLLVVAYVPREGGAGFEGVPPTTRTDASGNFSVSVQIPSQKCPSSRGVVVFACGYATCRPYASVPFTITDGLPLTGMGGSTSRRHSERIAAALSLIGAALTAAAIVRSKRRT